MDSSTATTATTLHVHRCRFVDYTPSAVTALAFPPLPLPSGTKGKERETNASQATNLSAVGTLAVGHANGNIDLCEWTASGSEKQASQAWVIRKTLAGFYPSKVDALSFIIKHPHRLSADEVPTLSNLRLFSSGGGSELLEWDLEKGCIKRTINSQGGCIWSLSPNAAGTRLALGCEDGWIRILDISDDGLHHFRRLDRVKGRILSIAWGPPLPPQKKELGVGSDSDDEEEWTDTFLVTGGSDSSLRKWDYASGRILERMSTDKVRGERTLVWTVGVLGDGTIVSGDSMGSVKFWDSRTATQLQTFKGHNADVLCMAFGPDGCTVYTSGVDQKVCQYSLIRLQKTESERTFTTKQWAQTSSRRLHSHDVRALALWPPYANLPASHCRTFSLNVAPIIASGGLDMSVVLTPAASPASSLTKTLNPLRTSVEASFADAYHRRLAYTNGRTTSIAKGASLVASMGDAHVSIWRVKRLEPEHSRDSDDFIQQQDKGGWQKVLEMDLHVQSNLTTCELSHNGQWLLLSDWYETKLFALDAHHDGSISPRRIRKFADILKSSLEGHPPTGATSAAFSPDSSKLVLSMAMTSFILILDLGDSANGPKVLRKFDHHRRSRLSARETKLVPVSFADDEDVEMGSGVDEDTDDISADIPASVYVSHIAISPDGQWLATSDERSRTHIYNLDSIQHHCVLPSFPLPCQALTFDPARTSLLIIAFPNNTLQIYDVESRQFPTWSRSLSTNLPKRLTQAHDPIIGISVDPAVTSSSHISPYLLLWGSTWLCKIRLDDNTLFPNHASKRKRRRESAPAPVTFDRGDEDQNNDFKMVTHYRPILLADFVGEGELVIVERPLVDVLATLPPAFFKHKYGSS